MLLIPYTIKYSMPYTILKTNMIFMLNNAVKDVEPREEICQSPALHCAGPFRE